MDYKKDLLAYKKLFECELDKALEIAIDDLMTSDEDDFSYYLKEYRKAYNELKE